MLLLHSPPLGPSDPPTVATTGLAGPPCVLRASGKEPSLERSRQVAHGSCPSNPRTGSGSVPEWLQRGLKGAQVWIPSQPPSSLVQHSFPTGKEAATTHWPHPKMRASVEAEMHAGPSSLRHRANPDRIILWTKS